MSNDQSIPTDHSEDITFLLGQVWRIRGELLLIHIVLEHLFEAHAPCQQSEIFRRVSASIKEHLVVLDEAPEKGGGQALRDAATEFIAILEKKLRDQPPPDTPQQGSA